jgi:hypothetical protein
MSTTEAPFVVSHNFCAVRGETVDELYGRLTELNEHPDIDSAIAEFRSKVSGATASQAVATAASTLGATVTSNNTPAAGPEIETDRYGAKYTYNHPDSPDLPDGRGKYVLKEWTSKQGKDLKAWVDPIKGPRPARSGEAEAPIIWK